MKAEEPLVSIVIPCYNLSGYLEVCINSCILQSYKNIEIIIVNDGSSDNTKEIIKYFAQIDNRIVPIHKDNEGVVKARITGIEKASGEYITFLDGDDYFPLNSIEILLNEMLSCKSDMVIGQMLEETNTGFQKLHIINNECIIGLDLVRRILYEKFFGLCGILYRRTLFNETLNFHQDLKNGEDVVLLIQLACNSKKIKCVDETVYLYRNRFSSVTKEPSDKNFQDSFKSRFLVEKYALEYGFEKEKDLDLGLFMCDSLNFMLLKRNFNSIDMTWKKLIKNKIKEYLFYNKIINSYYHKESKKNYCRLMLYYRFPYFYNETIFQYFYKVFKNIL